jgi:hypothetical protein
MLLYHFTAREYLADIRHDGLCRGEVPLSPRECLNAVWLTTDRDPSGHGLSDGEELSYKEKVIMGVDPGVRFYFPDKRAIRITLKIKSTDRRLVHWPAWGKKRLARGWYERLADTGDRKDRSWYLYWGVIPPESFLNVEYLHGAPADLTVSTASPELR